MVKTDLTNLGKYSKAIIELICDSCNIENKIAYKLYTSYGYSNGEYLCRKCKTKKNNLKKYGVENVFQLNQIKDKTKKTILEKYGVENISQNLDIKKTIKESKQKLNSNEINNKRKNTVLEKYGVDNVSKLDEIKEKKVNKNIESLGVSHNKKSEPFRKSFFKIANDPNYIQYKNEGVSIFKCDNNNEHIFDIDIEIYSKRKKYNTILCTICNPIDKNQSGKELSVYNYIESIYSGIINQNYKLDRKEIDIYLPNLKLGFEFNGIYWHSDLYKESDFHIKKTNYFLLNGIRIFHIWEDDWDFKKEILKSQINNLLKLNKIKIYARNCEIKLIDNVKLIKDFLNENHIQGYVNSNIKIGLFYNNDLVSLMTFDHFEGRNKMLDNEWNLSRFCTKLNTSVIGGASKLLKYFIKIYNPKRIISYADASWSNGNLYEKLNFKKINTLKQDYKFIVDGKRIHKSNYKKVNPYSPKIWDCGKIKYELIT